MAPGEAYVGMLFVEADALAAAAARNRVALDGAELEGGTVRLLWPGGGESRVDWRDLLSRAGLAQLPAPRVAFATGQGELGLLFESRTPHEGLVHREPHSVIRSLGRLTADGLVPELRPETDWLGRPISAVGPSSKEERHVDREDAEDAEQADQRGVPLLVPLSVHGGLSRG